MSVNVWLGGAEPKQRLLLSGEVMSASRGMPCSGCTLGMFGFLKREHPLPAAAARRGSIAHLPGKLRRRCGQAAERVTPSRANCRRCFDTSAVGLGANTLNVFTCKTITCFPKKKKRESSWYFAICKQLLGQTPGKQTVPASRRSSGSYHQR